MKYTLLILAILLSVVAPVFAQDTDRPVSYQIDPERLNLRHVYQGWNNCGPATLTMGLSVYGYPAEDFNSQTPAANYLKPNSEDQNVSPWQMVNYVNNEIDPSYGIQAIARRGGNQELLKTLIANDFPVIVEKGYEPYDRDGNYLDWMGHYLLLVGYDDTNQVFNTYDSYEGHGNFQGLPETYSELTRLWRHFNNTFIVIYEADREAELQSLLGTLWDEDAAWAAAVEVARNEASADTSDAWAWFNLGEGLTALGDYQNASIAYRAAFDTGQLPWRLLWYVHNSLEAFYQTGEFNTVLELINTVKVNTRFIEEMDYYQGLVYAAQGRTEDAIYRLNLVLAFNPNFYPAAEAKAQLEAGTFSGPTQSDV